jgi:hypothetical protein
VHAVLVAVKVVADHREAARPQQVAPHELLARLKVGPQADAGHRQIAAEREEVAALQIAGRLDGADDGEACCCGGGKGRGVSVVFGICCWII